MNTAIVKACLCLVTAVIVSGSSQALVSAEASSAPERRSDQVVSVHLRAVLKRANDAFRAGNNDLALKEVDAADAMQPKSPFDQYVIDQIRAATKARMQRQAQ